MAAIREAGGEPVDQVDRLVGCAQQQRAGVRGDRPTAKIRHQLAAIEASRNAGTPGYTVSAPGAPLRSGQVFGGTHTCADFRPRCSFLREIFGLAAVFAYVIPKKPSTTTIITMAPTIQIILFISSVLLHSDYKIALTRCRIAADPKSRQLYHRLTC